MNKRIGLRYAVWVLIFLMVAVFSARAFESYRYRGQAVIAPGLLYDRVCYKGSYEMIVCPYTVPPYETLIFIFGALLIACAWANAKKK